MISLFISIALAQSKAPTCQANNLYQQACQFFTANKNTAKFELPDGTWFENPLVNSATTRPYSLKPVEVVSTTEYDKDVIENLDMQIEMELQLNDLSKSNKKMKALPEKSRRYLLSPETISKLFPEGLGGAGALPVVYLPWPINDPNASTKALDKNEIESIKAFYSSEQMMAINIFYQKRAQKAAKKTSESLLSDDSLSLSGVTDKRRRRLDALVSDAKAKLIHFLKQGKNESQLSEEQKTLIKKIDTIKYNPGNDPMVQYSQDCIKGPNAFYLPSEHSINICDSVANLPDSQLIFIIGHELGHAIDPCSSASALYSVDKEKMPSFAENNSELIKSKEGLNFNALFGFTGSNSSYSSSAVDISFRDKSIIQKAESAGLISLVKPGMDAKNYPFEKTRQCLIEKMNFVTVTKEDINLAKKNAESLFARNEKSMSDQDKQRIESALNKSSQCIGLGSADKQPETNEALSDVFGAAVLSQYLAEKPASSEKEKIAAISFFTANACTSESAIEKTSDAELLAVISAAKSIKHPFNIRRVNRIVSQFPGISESLGCNSADNVCLKALKVSPASNSSTESSSSKESGGIK